MEEINFSKCTFAGLTLQTALGKTLISEAIALVRWAAGSELDHVGAPSLDHFDRSRSGQITLDRSSEMNSTDLSDYLEISEHIICWPMRWFTNF